MLFMARGGGPSTNFLLIGTNLFVDAPAEPGHDGAAMGLFSNLPSSNETLDPGAFLLRGFANGEAESLIDEIERIADAAPFRNMVTPGGFAMSVAMTNCGAFGWITDRKGYRYGDIDPDSGKTWPAMPEAFRDL